MFPVSFLDIGITSLFHLFVESLLTSYLLFKFCVYPRVSIFVLRCFMEDVLACRVDECISEGVPHGVAVPLVSLNISVRSLRRFIISNLMESPFALLYKGMLRGFWRCMTGLKSNSE